VLGLDVVQDEHGRHRAGEFAEGVEDVLRLERHAGLEPLVVDLGASAHAGAVAPRPRGVAVERPARPELALGEGLDRRRHVRVVRRAVGLEDSLAAGGVRSRPALVLVVAKAEPGHVGVARGPEHREAVDPVEHPAAEAHRLQHQHTGVAGGGELRGCPGQRVLLAEGQREGLLDVHQPAELLEPRDLSVVDVVVDREAVLDEEAEDRDQVLGEVRDGNDEQGAGHVDAPGVVPLQVGLLARQVEPAV
jgi:hypothetical protein